MLLKSVIALKCLVLILTNIRQLVFTAAEGEIDLVN